MPLLTNRLLASLSVESLSLLIPHLTEVALPVKAGVSEAEEVPRYCYFVTSGMISIVTTMEDGLAAEVAVIGCEGVFGALQLLGPGVMSTNAFVQLEGAALRIPFQRMQQVFHSSQEIRGRVLEFVQEQSICTAQIAGCNRLHEAEERLARWLLMAQDRTQRTNLHFTQEFLAMMLGARRSTVTLIAGMLQSSGLIQYSRGHIEILDRTGLEAAACDCYQVTKRLHDKLYTRPWAAPSILNAATPPSSRSLHT